MVIIAREVGVTLLRAVAVEEGVVISASWLGKVKTMLQVGAVFALIIFDPAPLAVDVLVYLAVAITVISGLDYFFGVRRRIEDERRRRAASRGTRQRVAGGA
jgi:CDP-diacylglycerol---glycerol-3-phosphate 3-phosphatidyltransferase